MNVIDWIEKLKVADGCSGIELVELLQMGAVDMGEIVAMAKIAESAAHIGVDFGYGEYQMEQEYIDSARVIVERDSIKTLLSQY